MQAATTREIGSWAEIRELIEKHGRLYVRWSAGPDVDLEMGESVDHASGTRHAGLSCNRLYHPDDLPHNLEHLPDCHVWSLNARKLTEYSYLCWGEDDRYGWLLMGTEAGNDSDGAASVVDWTAVGRLSDSLVERVKAYKVRYDDWRKAGVGRGAMPKAGEIDG